MDKRVEIRRVVKKRRLRKKVALVYGEVNRVMGAKEKAFLMEAGRRYLGDVVNLGEDRFEIVFGGDRTRETDVERALESALAIKDFLGEVRMGVGYGDCKEESGGFQGG